MKMKQLTPASGIPVPNPGQSPSVKQEKWSQWLAGGLLEEKAGQYEAAADAYLSVLLLESRQGQALLGLGRVYLVLGELDLASQFLESLLLTQPGHAEGRLMLGLVRYGQGNDAAAIRLLSRPEDPCALFWESRPARECLGECHYRQGDFERAILTWLPLLDHAPDSERLLLALGASLFHLGRYQSAYAFFQEAVRQNPANAGALNNCGVACFHLGDAAEAARWLEAALARDPDLGEARDNLQLLAPAAGGQRRCGGGLHE